MRPFHFVPQPASLRVEQRASRVCVHALLAMAVVLVAASCGDDTSGPDDTPDPNEPSTEDVIREATEPYQDVQAALAAGYAEASPCIASPAGGMGFHYGAMPLVDATVDPEHPELLLYEPDAGGELTLVGVEFLVDADAWDSANDDPPVLDQQFFVDHRAADARHGLPFAHYDLHVWVWKDNPAGLYAPFNPTVSCDAAGG